MDADPYLADPFLGHLGISEPQTTSDALNNVRRQLETKKLLREQLQAQVLILDQEIQQLSQQVLSHESDENFQTAFHQLLNNQQHEILDGTVMASLTPSLENAMVPNPASQKSKRGPYKRRTTPEVMRVCSKCGTTETPTWRCSSTKNLLCNSCGIWMKRREKELGKTLVRIDANMNLDLFSLQV